MITNKQFSTLLKQYRFEDRLKLLTQTNQIGQYRLNHKNTVYLDGKQLNFGEGGDKK